MNRREFLKSASILGFMLSHPGLLYASESKVRQLIHNIQSQVSYQKPSVWPIKWISIFLYGGPSELAGNLINIEDIDANSQNPYPDKLVPSRDGSSVTKNKFWADAGGNDMESLIASGDMSIYRTIHRIKDDNKSHPISVAQNLRGNLNTESPGFATILAAILAANNPFGKDINELLLPFVSLEGDSQVFYLGDESIPLSLRPVFLNSNFDNPYSRKGYSILDQSTDDKIEQLAQKMADRYGLKKIKDAFAKRKELADFIDSTLGNLGTNLPANPNHDPNNPDPDAPNGTLVYPDTGIGRDLQAAVSLCLENMDTVFVSISFGGWDNHSSAIPGYEQRVQRLMDALRCAVKHMRWKEATGNYPHAGNIFITVFGDFGRNVNLNASKGWDHGNTQNLYTVGGWNIPGRALGKLVGKTYRTGDSKVNRQFTKPTSDSYQCEPFSIVSTAYRYFGVQNPQVVTGEPAIDESNSVPNEFIP
ncbi:DUF1501 domain-containing protein [Hydrogenivirga sp.]